MDVLDSLPGDQRAVLALVLGRGRSYDDIARLLSIDRDAVRGRAHAALQALVPPTALADVDRARVGDYLLGQLPPADAARARAMLAASPDARAWAQVVSGALTPLATAPLPEIPDEGPNAAPMPDASPPAAPAVASEPPPQAAQPPPAPQPSPPPNRPRPAPAQDAERPRSSRRGGMVVIGLAVIVVVVVVVIVLRSTSHHHHSDAAAARDTTSARATTPQSSTTAASTAPAARVVAQINLTPTAAGSKAAGIAEVLAQGSKRELAIVAQHVPPNTTKPANAYEVWLYNSRGDATSLGFVNPGVSKNGRLSAAGQLPANASRYKQLVITTETSNKPKTPGPILLRGTVAGLS